MPNNEAAGIKSEVTSDESHFHLVIRVRHDEMAQWSPDRLATFFQAVSVLMAAKTHPNPPSQALVVAHQGAVAGGAVQGESLDAVEQRIKRIEQTVDGVRRHVATLHESVAEDFKAFEENLATHSAAIQSAKSAMSQTDDLVERVVEALEVLQTSALPSPADQALIAVN